MNLLDYIILGLLAAAVTGIIVRLIRKNKLKKLKKYGGSCCGNCSNCYECNINNCGKN